MKYFKSDPLDFQFITAKVGELIGINDPQKMRSHLSYLLEEISYAKYQWENSLEKEDWEQAATILHREKLIIQQLELAKDDTILLGIQRRDPVYQPAELKLFYGELIELFRELEKLVGSSV